MLRLGQLIGFWFGADGALNITCTWAPASTQCACAASWA